MASISRTILGSMDASTVLALSMILTATVLLSIRDRAWKTFPKLPLPRRRPSWYLPRRVAPAEGEDGGEGGGGGTPGSMAGGLEKERRLYTAATQRLHGDKGSELRGFRFYSIFFYCLFLFFNTSCIPGGVSIVLSFLNYPSFSFFLFSF